MVWRAPARPAGRRDLARHAPRSSFKRREGHRGSHRPLVARLRPRGTDRRAATATACPPWNLDGGDLPDWTRLARAAPALAPAALVLAAPVGNRAGHLH